MSTLSAYCFCQNWLLKPIPWSISCIAMLSIWLWLSLRKSGLRCRPTTVGRLSEPKSSAQDHEYAIVLPISVLPSALLWDEVTISRVSKLSMGVSLNPIGISLYRQRYPPLLSAVMANTLFLSLTIWDRVCSTVGSRLFCRTLFKESTGNITSPLPLLMSARPL